ncbi:MAG: hypothetical protein EP330_05605 [Deltaproteobacteria bacterium]|nr:MAG: hypothetical protein EP330_05605 [Deltaproteobacteria bacterium]
MTRIILMALAGAGLAACASPRHLGYDFGRAFTEAAMLQTDLTRPSVAAGGHPLNGNEAEAIRMQVSREASDQESGRAQLAN